MNVLPCMSAAVSVPWRARSISVARQGGKLAEGQPADVADHRYQQASIGIDGDPDVDRRRRPDLVAAPAGIQERMFFERQRRQLDEDVGVSRSSVPHPPDRPP